MSSPSEHSELSPRLETLIGEVVLERYRVDEMIGVGAMGAVFKVRHLGLRRDMAMKVLRPELTADREMAKRFEREAASASRIDHPNCVAVTDYGSTDDGLRFLVMQLLQGEELKTVIDRAALKPSRAIKIGLQVLRALEHAHAQGVVHRDIKPENVFLTRDHDGEERAKVLDFGIAKIVSGEGADDKVTRAGMIFGTPEYMSPEQAGGGALDARTDLYSVGILLYEMIAGEAPFHGEEAVATVRKQMSEPPPPLPPGVPDALRPVVSRLLNKKPKDRYPDAAAAIAALETVRSGMQRPSSEDARAGAPVRSGHTVAVGTPKRPWLPWAIAGGLAALALPLLLSRSGDDTEPPAERGQAVDLSGWKLLADRVTGRSPPSSSGDVAAAAAATRRGDVVRKPRDDTDTSREPASSRAPQSSVAALDALFAAGKHEAASISIAPLLVDYPDDPQLHWRKGRLVARGGKKQSGNALRSYGAAVQRDAAILEDPRFMEELSKMMRKREARDVAVDTAVVHLGDRGLPFLIGWVNLDRDPLDYNTRHRAIDHLEVDPGARINRPLNTALDLWQAGQAEDPCGAFEQALATAEKMPDSYLLGTLSRVQVPNKRADEGKAPEACRALAEPLAKLRAEYEAQYQGIVPIAPRAYTKKQRRRR